MSARVLDERTSPTLRRLIGRLLEESERADLALTRIRLAALDLTPAEIAGPRECRVLIGRLDAAMLMEAAEPVVGMEDTGNSDRTVAARARLDSLHRLGAWIRSGRIHVRSAGIGAWTPDFSVFHRPGGGTCLLGAHYFGHPQLTVGPSITVVTDSPVTRELLSDRFGEIWSRAHDVAPAIQEVLRRAIRGAAGAYWASPTGTGPAGG